MSYAKKFPAKRFLKASQCRDINDLEFTHSQLWVYAFSLKREGYKPPPGFYTRLNSIESKFEKLTNKPAPGYITLNNFIAQQNHTLCQRSN